MGHVVGREAGVVDEPLESNLFLGGRPRIRPLFCLLTVIRSKCVASSIALPSGVFLTSN